MTFLRRLAKPLQYLQRLPVLFGLTCVCCLIFLSSYGTDLGSLRFNSISVSQSDLDGESDYPLLLQSYGKSDNTSLADNGIRSIFNNTAGPPPVRWTYVCQSNACVKREVEHISATPSVAFEVCWLTCGSHGSLWPYPRKEQRSPDTVRFLPENLHLEGIQAESEAVQELIKEAFDIKKKYFESHSILTKAHQEDLQKKNRLLWPLSKFFGDGETDSDIASTLPPPLASNSVRILIITNQTDLTYTLETDESYEISIEEAMSNEPGSYSGIQLLVKIRGSTFFGVRHGIETFSQLVALDNVNKCLQTLRAYYAYDKPHYPYRGVLIDCSRNFIPLNILRRVVDGMGMNKLNILHLHLTDSNTFPFHSKRVPQMSEYGALSPDQIYYAEDLQGFVRYAKVRGVKIVPELDAPSHAGIGWQFGRKYGLGDLAFYINRYDGSWPRICGQPPCGILNPVNKNTYDILGQLYADLLDIFDNDLFHQGGDEVNLESWTRRPELSDMNGMNLWKMFQTEAYSRLKKISTNVTAILWTSHLTATSDVQKVLNPKNYIIQSWESIYSPETQRLLEKGYRLIISFVDKLYLDWGMGTWLGRNHKWEYLPWQYQYDANRQLARLSTKRTNGNRQILGVEAPLWGEKVGQYDLEIKLWPRAAALAEGFWSSPIFRGEEVYTRINYHNYRMQKRGIPTSQLQPESCLHFNGNCENPSDIL